MDVFSVLQKDHDTLRELLARLEHLPWEESATARRLFDDLVETLEAHTYAENAVVYRRLLEKPSSTRLAREALQAHASCDVLLDRLSELEIDDDRWHLGFEELKEELRAHLDDEEDRVFKRLHGLFRERDWEEMGQALLTLKERGLAA